MDPLTVFLWLGFFVLATPGYHLRLKIGDSGIEFKKDGFSIKQLKEGIRECIDKLLK